MTQDMTRKMMMIKKTLLMVLMVAFGTTVSWGQITDGLYYIASNNNKDGDGNDYYLNKSTVMYESGQPYLTTFKSGQVDESVWRLKWADKVDEVDYYYIIHEKDAQYLTLNDSKTTNDARLRVHLQSTPGDNNSSLFYFTKSSSVYNICPKNDTDNRSLNPAGDNYNQADAYEDETDGKLETLIAGGSMYTAGLIGLWVQNNERSLWKMNRAPQCGTPVITFNYPDGTVTITTETVGATIYYTTDGSDPTLSTSTTRKIYDANYLPTIGAGITEIKACAVKKWMNNSSVAPQSIVFNPTITLTEESITYDAADHNPTISVSVTIGETPTNIAADEYTVSYIKDGKEYDNCKDAGTYTVALKDVDGGTYVVYGTSTTTHTINKAALTITAEGKTVNYGDEINNSVSYSGFKGTPVEDESVLNGTLTYSYNSAEDGSGTAYTTPVPVGTCYIIPGGLTAQNYAITFAAGTLSVNAKALNSGEDLAAGFTVSVDDDGNIVLKDGDKILDASDYTVANVSTTENGKYTTKTITGNGNINGSVTITIANVNFQTDDNQIEWSATFVAEGEDSDPGHVLPEGMSAYIIKSIEGNWAMTEALNYIPKGVPVLLQNNAAAKGFAVKQATTSLYTSDELTAINAANKLKIVTETTPNYDNVATSDHYQSAYFDQAKIYLLYHNEFARNLAGYLAKGKVYLEKPAAASPAPARLSIAWGNTTGIEGVRWKIEEVRSDYWYTLDGLRLSGKPTKKGLYINNGNKVVIK
jgi:hypothetical protein